MAAEEVGSVKVGIQVDEKDFIRMMERAGHKGSKAMDGILGKTIKFGAIAAGFKVISSSIASVTSKAMEVVESENLFKESMGNMAGAATDWSKSLASAVGLNEFELRKNIGTLNVMTKSMGLTKDQAFGLSKDMVELSHDMASFYNINQTDAMEKIKSGIVGMSRPLMDLGIIVNETAIKQTAYAEGIAEVGAELTQTQKVMARYRTILNATTVAQGDMARTIKSPANQLRVLQTRLEVIQINIGKAFLPIAEVVLPLLNSLAQSLVNITSQMANFIQMIFQMEDKTAQGANKAAEAQQNLAGAVNDTAKAAKRGVAGFDEINQLTESAGASGINKVFEMKSNNELLEEAKETQETILKTDSIFKTSIDKIKNNLDRLKEPMGELGSELEILGGHYKNAFEKVAGKALEFLADKTEEKFDKISIVSEIGMEALRQTIKGVNYLIETDWDTVWLGIKETHKDIMTKINEETKEKTGLSAKTIKNSLELMFGDTNTKLKGIRGLWNTLWENVNTEAGTENTKLQNTWRTTLANMLDKTSGTTKGIAMLFINAFDTVIAGINRLIFAWNDLEFKTPDFFNPFTGKMQKGIRIKTPDINPIKQILQGTASTKSIVPRFAQGGLVSNPTFAEIGEGRHDEAVLPLNDAVMGRLAGMITQGMSQANQFNQPSGGNTIQMNVDGKTLARILIPAMETEQSRIGMRTVVQGV